MKRLIGKYFVKFLLLCGAGKWEGKDFKTSPIWIRIANRLLRFLCY